MASAAPRETYLRFRNSQYETTDMGLVLHASCGVPVNAPAFAATHFSYPGGMAKLS